MWLLAAFASVTISVVGRVTPGIAFGSGVAGVAGLAGVAGVAGLAGVAGVAGVADLAALNPAPKRVLSPNLRVASSKGLPSVPATGLAG
ncbi:hypothetical protein DWZ19_08885 [Streptococcus parasanguinis]|uniref:Uncharacterized protein n=1 Tax=Streptococcus parasanguinis TaxID=1318 RepID=A0AAE8ADE0_STRPA|nr:hypothetical protein DWZ19_08885 [Streptococcus parasanguinis]